MWPPACHGAVAADPLIRAGYSSDQAEPLLPVSNETDPTGKVPRKSCLVILRCARVEDDSRFRHEPAFWPLILPASRGGDGLRPP